MANSDIDDWTIRFVDTGLQANIGMRLKAAQEHLDGDEIFMANYSDGLTDLPLDSYVENFQKRDKVASFVSVPNPAVTHMVESESDGTVTAIGPMSQSGVRINGGFFIFRNEIFEFIKDGEELVYERHRHRYEVNNHYRADLEAAGMSLSGTSPDDHLVEIIELPEHPFFIASQFHPELKSRPTDPHPLFVGFLAAALEYRRRQAESTIEATEVSRVNQ